MRSLSKSFQECFYVSILHPVLQLNILSAIEDISPLDWTKPSFCSPAFVLVNEMPVLKGDLFTAVFDFKNLTAVFFLIIDDHIKFTDFKLQFENTVILVSCLHGFQEYDIISLVRFQNIKQKFFRNEGNLK